MPAAAAGAAVVEDASRAAVVAFCAFVPMLIAAAWAVAQRRLASAEAAEEALLLVEARAAAVKPQAATPATSVAGLGAAECWQRALAVPGRRARRASASKDEVLDAEARKRKLRSFKRDGA